MKQMIKAAMPLSIGLGLAGTPSAFVPSLGATHLCGTHGSLRGIRPSARVHLASGLRMQDGDEAERKRMAALEDEVKDNTGAISYVFPRPFRKVVWGAFALNSFIGALVLGGRYAAEGLEEDLRYARKLYITHERATLEKDTH